MPLTVEDLALTALVRILPRSRYRLAGQTDSRFESFAGNTARIAYRQQGATPAFLLFSGPGQDPRAAATAAASWAHASWRPNAVQRSVSPGVVAVHVAPANQLSAAGPIIGTAVPAAIWTVDSETGRVDTSGNPPGSPPSGEIKRAAAELLKGVPPPALGELDLAERNVMQLRTAGPPRILSGVLGICLLLVALRFGFGGLLSLVALPGLIAGGNATAIASGVVGVLILAGLLLGIGLLFNLGNMAYRTPGFSSTTPRTRNLSWGAFIAIMVGLLVFQAGVLPSGREPNPAATSSPGQYLHLTATVTDDGSEVYVTKGGDVTVDLTGWPQGEWGGVAFKSSNPSVLKLAPETTQTPLNRPVAHFDALTAGVSRVEASSRDGSYSFQLRVDVGAT